MEQITQTEAIKRIKENKETFILYPDGTEATAETKAEIIAAAKNGLKFGFEEKDLFEFYTEQPQEVSEILSRYELEEIDYTTCENLLAELNAVGFTFDYGLCAEPINLRKIETQQNHIQDQEQRPINKFFNWFKSLGGNVANFKADEIAEQFQEPKFFVSTLKNRAEEVKQKYNHKFTFNI
jgi:hypothetical protein